MYKYYLSILQQGLSFITYTPRVNTHIQDCRVHIDWALCGPLWRPRWGPPHPPPNPLHPLPPALAWQHAWPRAHPLSTQSTRLKATWTEKSLHPRNVHKSAGGQRNVNVNKHTITLKHGI